MSKTDPESRSWLIALLTMTCLIDVFSGYAYAQPQRMTYTSGRTGVSGSAELPFNNTYRRPSLSPYNALQQNVFNPLANQNVYQQMVQPQLQQQQQQIEQLSQRRQMQRLQNQVQQIGRDTSGRQIDESIRPTGHRATYLNYSHFYQQ